MSKWRRAVLCFLIGTAFVAALQMPLGASQVVIPNSTFTFTGDCLDCTGQGSGILILQNYTLGNAFDISNFVSFSYSSDLTTFVLSGTGFGPDQVSDFSGSLPAALPAFADVNISSQGVQAFGPASSGSWCAGVNGCNLDFGVNGVFASDVPEPASLALMFTGFAGLMLMGLRRTKHRMN
jgi:hypothetical protein